jgi:beta-lactamase regulating signal transducer with metallopeptidase domain
MNPMDPTLQTMAWAMVHFLWQGCLIWLVTSLALHLTRAFSPQPRYLIACCGLALCLLLPLGTFAYLHPAVLRQFGEQAFAPSAPFSTALVAGSVPVGLAHVAELPRRVGYLFEGHLPLLLKGWLIGSLLLALRFGGGWLHLLTVRRAATQASKALQDGFDGIARRCGVSRPIRLALSSRINTPVVVGWLRPLLLVPVGLLSGMDPVGLEALLVHELAHIRRHDYFVNIVQCVVEILLFYHPAVWWISHRVRTERELCCDDAAVNWCDDPLLYAETLTRLHELRSETLTPALAAGGGDLMFRIKRLVIPSLSPSTIPISLNLMALACSVFLGIGASLSLNAMQAGFTDGGKWFLAGSDRKNYVYSTDTQIALGDKPSQSLSCAVNMPDGFGTIMQNYVPSEYLGRRVRLSAWVKTANVTGWAGLWMRVDGASNATLGFDNMGQRPIKGTTDWTRYEVVLDVASSARNLAFGLLLDGPGQAWLNDLQFEIVDSNVATTKTAGGPRRSLPPDMNLHQWFLAGSHPKDYAISLDQTTLRGGKPAHLLASNADKCNGFGTLMQMFKGQAYLGKRVRLSAWVKSENVESWAGIWMRVDGPDGKSTAFDNMGTHPIKDTLDWDRYQVVLDMAPDSSALALGILLSGKGKVWMEEPTLEVVDGSVPVTDMKLARGK